MQNLHRTKGIWKLIIYTVEKGMFFIKMLEILHGCCLNLLQFIYSFTGINIPSMNTDLTWHVIKVMILKSLE